MRTEYKSPSRTVRSAPELSLNVDYTSANSLAIVFNGPDVQGTPYVQILKSYVQFSLLMSFQRLHQSPTSV
jgi:hypothetical protein